MVNKMPENFPVWVVYSPLGHFLLWATSRLRKPDLNEPGIHELHNPEFFLLLGLFLLTRGKFLPSSLFLFEKSFESSTNQ